MKSPLPGIQGLTALLAVFTSALSGCGQEPELSSTGHALVLGERREREVTGALGVVEGPGGILLAWTPDGAPAPVVEHSPDGGATWAPFRTLSPGEGSYRWDPQSGLEYSLRFGGEGPALVVRGANSETETTLPGWAARMERAELALGPGERLGIAWVESLGSAAQLLFSSSPDHGHTWRPPVPVDPGGSWSSVYGSLELVPFRRGWALAWSDNRSAATEFDIYLSLIAAAGGGRQGPRSRRVNDDRTEGWNVDAALASDGRRVFVAFQDFRERNRFGDLDANVYFARLDAEGRRAGPNVRLNDHQDSIQGGPALLYLPERGLLLAAWTDQRNSLTGDVYAAASLDGGRTWTPNRRLSRGSRTDQLKMSRNPWLVRSGDRAFAAWIEHAAGARRVVIRPVLGVAEEDPEPPPEESSPPPPPPVQVAPPAEAESVASLDFDGGTLEGLRPLRGTWLAHDGAALAFGAKAAAAEIEGALAADFVLEGRFRLDPLRHESAILFFRIQGTDGGSPRGGYALANLFREGLMLLHSDTELALHPRHGNEVVTDTWWPVLQDVWYRFRLVVAGDALDYYLDGRRVLAHRGLHRLRSGRILLGGGFAPVEYDDVRLYRFRSDARRAKSRGLVEKRAPSRAARAAPSGSS